MENTSPSHSKAKIIPLARKKLLAQALINDSPVKVLLKTKRFSKHSANSSFASLHNSSKFQGYNSVIVSPLREKDSNHQNSLKNIKKTKQIKPKNIGITTISNFQDLFIRL